MKQQTKNQILVGVLLLVFILAVRFGFYNTYDLGSSIANLEQQKDIQSSAPSQLIALKATEKKLDSVLGAYQLSGVSLQNNLLKVLHKLSVDSLGSEKIKITGFQTPHEFMDKQLNQKVVTYNFSLQGSYKDIIVPIYQLEQRYSFGNVVHLNFEKKYDFRTRKSLLECNVLLQRLD